MGELLAQGRTREDIRSIMGVLPEGYNTLQAVLAIAGRDCITMPLASAINVIADGRLDAAAFIRSFVTDTYCLCRRSN
jgi:glycerol-3-phosphate dehydrogenase